MIDKKRKSIALAALMVLSTVAIAGSGLAAEVPRGSEDPTFNPGVGGDNDVVVSQQRPVVYRGEDDVQFVTRQGDQVDPSNLVGVSGDAEGVPLETPIPEDQILGQYTIDGQQDSPGVTVQQPRVTDLEVFNERGADVADSSVPEDEILLVRGEWNFQRAEDLSIEVLDENGNEITGDVLTDEGALSDQQIDELTGLYAEFPAQVGNPGQRGTGTEVEYLQGFGQFSDQQVNNTTVGIDAAYWAIDLSDQDAGQYTITVEGWDNLDFGPATQTSTVELTTETDVTLDLESDEATRGQYVPFTIRGSNAGATHYLTVERDDFRNDQVDERVFREVENVQDRGTVDENDDGEADFAFAQVVVDEDTGLGEGQLDTTYLDDTNVDVNLYDEDLNITDVTETFDNPEDDLSLRVVQGGLSIEEPAGTYVAGSEVDVSGTAQQGIDDVALYVRDQGDWELIDVNTDGDLDTGDLISVDADGEWEERDVQLSQANDILAIPGRYRFGVVEAEDVVQNDTVQESLTTSEFSSATSEQSSILVTEPGLGPLANQTDDGESSVAGPAGGLGALPAGAFASVSDVHLQQEGNETGNETTQADNETAEADNETQQDQQPQADGTRGDRTPLVFLSYNGQVATDDGTVDVLGTAPGQEDVLIVMIDSRGRVVTEQVTVDDDDVFEEDDIPLVTQEGQELNEGTIWAAVIAVGRDNVAGDGVLPGETGADLGALENYAQALSGTGLTQQQVSARIADETIEDAGADDLWVRDEFRYVDGSINVETVRPEQVNETGLAAQTGIEQVRPGDTVFISGLTNRKPDDNTVAIDVIEGPSANEFPSASTDQWGIDGRWNVTIDVPEDVEPGLYTLEADDGDNTDQVTFSVVTGQEIVVENVTVGQNATEAPMENETAGTVGNETGDMAGNETEAGANETAG